MLYYKMDDSTNYFLNSLVFLIIEFSFMEYNNSQ